MRINNQNYVDEAEKVILNMKQEKVLQNLTTTKLRNLLAMSSDIYNDVMNNKGDKLKSEICSRIEYLRVRFLYEAGRDYAVRKLVEKAGIIQILKEIGNSKEKYILFNRYMEALVAFHRFNGGND